MLQHLSNKALAIAKPLELLAHAFAQPTPSKLFWHPDRRPNEIKLLGLSELEKKISALIYEIDCRMDQLEKEYPGLVDMDEEAQAERVPEYPGMVYMATYFVGVLHGNFLVQTLEPPDVHLRVCGDGNGILVKCFGDCDDCLEATGQSRN